MIPVSNSSQSQPPLSPPGVPHSLGATKAAAKPPLDATREAFGDFVGQTMFGSMLASMRESVATPAYFHGGRTEEVFQRQLDQHLVEAVSDASSERLVDPMYELFQAQRH